MPWSGGTYRKGNYGSNGWTGDASLGIGIEAGRHDTQDDDFANGISDCINKNGGNVPTANLPMNGFKHTNVAAASSSTDYARYDQVTGLIPAGTIWQYAAGSAPTGWLICDGSAVSRGTYSALFAIISTTYGAGDGSTTFNLPDLVRRTPLGKGASDSLGDSDGVAAASRTLTHTHTVPAHNHGMGTGADLNIVSSGATTTATDGAHSHSFTYRQTPTGFGAGAPAGASATGTLANWTTATDGAHSHSVNAHTHSSANFAGRIGLVTGGVDGNAAMTSGATNNSNYLILNYIIKY